MITETFRQTIATTKESDLVKKVTCLLYEGAMYVPADAVEKLTEVSAALERANEELVTLREELEMERAAKDLAEAKCELAQLKLPVYSKLFHDMRMDYDREVSRRLKLEREMVTHDEIEKVVHAMLDKRLEEVFRTAWGDSPLFDGPYSSPDSQYLRNLTNEVIDSVDWAGASSELLGRTFVADQVRATKGDAQP